MNRQKRYSSYTLAMKNSMIMDLIEKTRRIPDFISFAGGSPSSKTFPKRQLAYIFKQVIEKYGNEILHYGFSGGDRELKEAIIESEGLNVSLDEIQICSGAANGIYNAVRTFIEPGDIIICEEPSFLGSLVTFEAAGASLKTVPLQDDGIDLEKLTEIINTNRSDKIKFIYTIPDFQNPTGITMSEAKREAIIDIAVKHNILIVEDNPYGKLRLTGHDIPTLFNVAQKKGNDTGIVISIHSFSKIIGPGMRVGYTLADTETINYMNSWLQKGLNTTDRVSQRVVAEFLSQGMLEGQLQVIRDTYEPLLNKMITSLRRYMPADVKWINPEGGMFVWLQLPEHCDTDRLFDKAVENKVAYLPGSNFYASGCEKYNCLRLNFTFPDENQIEEGIQRLGKVLEDRNK